MAERDTATRRGTLDYPAAFRDHAAGRRRSYPRIELGKPATVRLKGGEVAHDAVFDVSRGGLQLRCDRAFAKVLHPAGTAIKEGRWPKVSLAVKLPYPEGLPNIVVGCTLRYVRGLDDGRFAFGVQFERFKGDGEAYLLRFVEDSLRPAETPE